MIKPNERIKNNEVQCAYQKQARHYHYVSSAFLIIFIISIFITFLVFFHTNYRTYLFLLIPTNIFLILQWEQYFIKALKTSKEQDRVFFLQSIRAARNIDELNKAGLFAYFKDNYGTEWIKEVNVCIANLKESLKKPPEWLDEETNLRNIQ